MRPDLPDFANPPLVEVALCAQFEPLTPLRGVHLGLLWDDLRERFPKTEDRAPLDPVIEDFDHPSPRRSGVRFEALEAPPLPRVWFVNDAGTELVQVQRDRFVRNWRKVGEGGAYPRYESILESFRGELGKFSRFVAREGLGDLHFKQCEVTYVNHIVQGEGWQRHGEVDKVFGLWSPPRSGAFLREPEDATFAVRYRIPGVDGKPAGRLHAQVQSALRTIDSKPLYVLTLTARGAPRGEGIEGVVGFLDLGRTWIVNGFASITTPAMHSIWRRLDVKQG